MPISKPLQSKPSTPVSPVSPPTNPLLVAPTFSGERQPSIIPDEMEGFVFITGFRGKGKTVLGTSFDHPDNVLHFDMETKGGTISKPLGIKAYFPILSEVVGHHGDDFPISVVWERVMTILRAVPKDRYTVLFLDNCAYIHEGAAQLLRSNPVKAGKYGIEAKNLITGGYGGAWPGVKYMLNALFKLANSKGIKLVVGSFQLTTAWKDSKPLFNKFKSTDIGVYHEQSILTLALIDPHPKYSPTPRALVLKESLPDCRWDDTLKRVVTKRKLPYAIPQCEPWRIYEYLRTPADLDSPAEGESVTAAEIDPFKPTFGQEQLALLERLSRVQKELYGDDSDDEKETP